MTEKQLKQQFEQAFTKYGPMVFRRCLSIVKEENVAKDLMQEVFVRVLERGGLPLDAPSSFLYTIATNLSLNFVRDHKKFAQGDEVLLEIASGDDFGRQNQLQRWLAKAFSEEKTDTRVMAYMHWVDGYTLKEIARELGYSESGIRKRLREFREKVREGVELESVV